MRRVIRIVRGQRTSYNIKSINLAHISSPNSLNSSHPIYLESQLKVSVWAIKIWEI